MAKPRTVKHKPPPAPLAFEGSAMYPQSGDEAQVEVLQPPTVPFVALWSLIAVVASVMTVLTTLVPDGPARSVVALVVVGLVQPALEWWLLQRYVPGLPLLQWWAYNVLGLILGALALMVLGVVFIMVGLQFGNSQQTGQALADASAGPLGVILTGALGGLVTAGARWLLLKRYFNTVPLLFFVGTMVGLILGGFVGPLGFALFERGTLSADLATNALSALVSGAFTGAAMLTLFRGHTGRARS